MGGQQLLVGLALDAGQGCVVLLHRIAADVLVVHEVGGGSNIERSGGGIVDAQLVGATLYFAIGLDQYAALSFQAGLDPFLFHTIDNGGKLIHSTADTLMLRHGKDILLQLTVEIDVELQFSFLRCRQSDDNHLISLRGKDGTFVLHTITDIRGGSGGIAEV